MRGGGCTCCYNRTVVKGFNDIATTDPWMIEFLADKEDAYKYTSQSSRYVKAKCSDCGYEKYTLFKTLYENHGFICPKCGDGVSYPEKFMYNTLEQLSVQFETQYSPLWANKFRYDFYIPKFNLIIETHGQQHYMNCGSWNKNNQCKTDKEKEELALNNGINKYIIIDCRESQSEYIKKSILSSDLIYLFDFSNIDWIKSNKYATNSMVKKVCLYYNEHKYTVSIKDMASHFKICRDTIRKYLNIGSKLGWCDYDKTKSNYTILRPIRIIETNDEFESISSCIKQVEILYGIKLNQSCIWFVLTGKREHHKGFHFEYI